MSYFSQNDGRVKRPGIPFIIFLSFISAVFGGLFVIFLAPNFLVIEQPPQLEQQEQAWDYSDRPVLPFDVEDSPVIGIAERVGPAVVSITNLRGRDFFNNPLTSSGSGVIFDAANGYIITNFHVVEGANNIEVTLDEENQYEAELVGYDANSDLAVLRIDADELPEAQFGDSSRLRVGELAVAIGNPLGSHFARSVTTGVISALDREITVAAPSGEEITLQVIQTDAAINPGNSGGALVNAKGEVVGINSVKIARADVEGMGFAIPSDIAKPIIDQLIKQGYVSRPYVGIYDLREITPLMSQWYALPEGLSIGGIMPNSPAMAAGMQPGDVIIQMQGEDIKTYEKLQQILKEHEVGDKVSIVVVRDNKRVELSITLGEMPRR